MDQQINKQEIFIVMSAVKETQWWVGQKLFEVADFRDGFSEEMLSEMITEVWRLQDQLEKHF